MYSSFCGIHEDTHTDTHRIQPWDTSKEYVWDTQKRLILTPPMLEEYMGYVFFGIHSGIHYTDTCRIHKIHGIHLDNKASVF